MKSVTSPCFLLAFCILFFAPPSSYPFVSGTSSKCTRPAQGLLGGAAVFNINGPCSGLLSEKPFPDSSQILGQEEDKMAPIAGNSRSLGAGNFLVKVGFGTPSRTFNLVLDTGSDETWIKCKSCSRKSSSSSSSPCDKNQKFNPSVSSTFSKCSYDCTQERTYFDKSSFKGTWAFDTLSIPYSAVSFPKFRFVCADQAKGFDKSIDGLLGLGQGDYSLVSQTPTASERAFCYCLPGNEASNGYVLFGSQARQTCQFTSFTPLLTSSDSPNRYFINLMSISIGNKTLDVSYESSSSPGAMLDSGTVITKLPRSTYEQFRDTFKQLMMSYTIAHPPSKEKVLDTCYKLMGSEYETMEVPNVVLHFENVDVKLDKSQLLWSEGGKSPIYCLAFGVNKDDNNLAIIGNNQQQKLNVLYDIYNSRVGIQAGNCGK